MYHVLGRVFDTRHNFPHFCWKLHNIAETWQLNLGRSTFLRRSFFFIYLDRELRLCTWEGPKQPPAAGADFRNTGVISTIPLNKCKQNPRRHAWQ